MSRLQRNNYTKAGSADVKHRHKEKCVNLPSTIEVSVLSHRHFPVRGPYILPQRLGYSSSEDLNQSAIHILPYIRKWHRSLGAWRRNRKVVGVVKAGVKKERTAEKEVKSHDQHRRKPLPSPGLRPHRPGGSLQNLQNQHFGFWICLKRLPT